MVYTIIAMGIAVFGVGMTLYFQAQIILKPKKQTTFAKSAFWFGTAWMLLGLVIAIGGLIGLFTKTL
jgi:hypothetical protein